MYAHPMPGWTDPPDNDTTHNPCRYLETFKAYEHKGCESIQERVDAEYGARCDPGRGGMCV